MCQNCERGASRWASQNSAPDPADPADLLLSSGSSGNASSCVEQTLGSPRRGSGWWYLTNSLKSAHDGANREAMDPRIHPPGPPGPLELRHRVSIEDLVFSSNDLTATQIMNRNTSKVGLEIHIQHPAFSLQMGFGLGSDHQFRIQGFNSKS